MGKLNIAAGSWVVVCDGQKALICENAGDEVFLNLRVIEERAIENPPTAAQGADRPGRVHASASTERSAVGQTDWHDQAENHFLKELAVRLDRAVAKGEVDALVVVAPPRALGMIRPAFSAGVAKAVTAELDKDYVNLPIDQIEKRLKA